MGRQPHELGRGCGPTPGRQGTDPIARPAERILTGHPNIDAGTPGAAFARPQIAHGRKVNSHSRSCPCLNPSPASGCPFSPSRQERGLDGLDATPLEAWHAASAPDALRPSRVSQASWLGWPPVPCWLAELAVPFWPGELPLPSWPGGFPRSVWWVSELPSLAQPLAFPLAFPLAA